MTHVTNAEYLRILLQSSIDRHPIRGTLAVMKPLKAATCDVRSPATTVSWPHHQMAICISMQLSFFSKSVPGPLDYVLGAVHNFGVLRYPVMACMADDIETFYLPRIPSLFR